MPDNTTFTLSSVLPYSCQTIGQDDIDAVVEVLKSSYLTQGPAVERFEKSVADYCDVPYAVAFSSGTAALHGACYAAEIEAEDEVITSPITFVATSNAVIYSNGRPIFADINPDSWNLDPEETASKIGERTKALIPVHFAGQPADLESFYKFAEEHNLLVIEDACHALGAYYKGFPIGHCRDMAVFSFHPVKSITTGEGGMVVTPHRDIYEKLLRFRSHGISKSPGDFLVFEGSPWEYEMQELGYNYRITDIQAAMGISQMEKLDQFIQRRNYLAYRYREAFLTVHAVKMQQQLSDTRSADHLFPIRIDPELSPVSRKELFNGLVRNGIRPQVHYIPIHCQPYYREYLGTRIGDFPVAEQYYEQCISLPLYPNLTDEEQDYVIKQVKMFLGAS